MRLPASMEKAGAMFRRGPQGEKSEAADKDATAGDAERTASGLVDTPIRRVTWRSLVMGVFVSMGGFIFGYDTGQISGILEMDDFLQRFGEPKANGEGYEFSNVRAGLIVALLAVGTLMGALAAGPVADRIGRKWSICSWCVILHVGIIVQMAVSGRKWYQVAIGRWVAGLGVGALSLLVPLYQGESAPRQIRGALVSTYQLFITLGIFIANCINFGTEGIQSSASWRITIGVTFVWVFILQIGIMFFPESPRYDYKHGRVDRAKRTMMKLYGIPANHRQLHFELKDIDEKVKDDWEGRDDPWYSIFTAPRVGYRLVLGIALQALQQLTGANYFFYYGTVVFQGAGISNSYVTQMIMGGVNFGSTFLGLYNIEHFGRRKSLIIGSIWMCACFLVFASVGHFALDIDNPENTPNAGTAMVVFACLFILAYASTWGPMIWAIVAELYPSRFRAKGMALATASNWLWNFLLAFFTPFIVGEIDFMYGYVFAGCLFLGALVVYFGVIEGAGRTLEELDTMYVLRVKPWKSSKYEIPPPEELPEGVALAGNRETSEETAVGEDGQKSQTDGTEHVNGYNSTPPNGTTEYGSRNDPNP